MCPFQTFNRPPDGLLRLNLGPPKNWGPCSSEPAACPPGRDCTPVHLDLLRYIKEIEDLEQCEVLSKEMVAIRLHLEVDL
jgi:hypothetical protein